MTSRLVNTLCTITSSVLILTVIACGGPVPKVQVISSGGAIEKIEIFTEPIVQDNCDHDRDLLHTVERSQSITYVVEVGGGIKVDRGGKISGGLPADVAQVEVSVGTEVAAHYGVSYGKEETFTKSLSLVTGPHTRAQYDIQHLELWETGKLVITIGDWSGEFPYRFRRGFGLEQKGSQDLVCPTLTNPPSPGPSPMATAGQETPVAPPTEAPDTTCPFFDDFEMGAVDPSRWAGDEDYDDYVSVKDGHLTFDTPLNAGAKGIDPKLADAQLSDWSVSRIMFTFKLDVPAGADTGFLYFATSCKPDYDQVWIKALDQEDRPWAALLRDGTVVDKVFFEPVARDEAHTLELRWQTDHIQVYIDGQLQDGTIPCQEPGGYAHFGVDLPPETRFVGYLDDICIWP